MGDPFIGEVKVIAFNYPPKGWAFCNGQLLPISQNQALFSILGTTYGGDGRTTFGLPNLQGATPVHSGNGILLGQKGGETSHTLMLDEMPAHTHFAQGNSGAANATSPIGNTWSAAAAGTNVGNPYAATSNATMEPAAITATGGGQPHMNFQPYLVLNLVIALQGIFPSRT